MNDFKKEYYELLLSKSFKIKPLPFRGVTIDFGEINYKKIIEYIDPQTGDTNKEEFHIQITNREKPNGRDVPKHRHRKPKQLF